MFAGTKNCPEPPKDLGRSIRLWQVCCSGLERAVSDEILGITQSILVPDARTVADVVQIMATMWRIRVAYGECTSPHKLLLKSRVSKFTSIVAYQSTFFVRAS